MALVETARFGRLLRRLMGMKGDVPLELQNVIVPILPLGWPDDPSFLGLRGELPFSANINSPAVAGLQSRCGILNVPNSGRMVIVDQIWVSSTAAATTFQVGIIFVAAGVQTPVVPRDTRLRTNTTPTAIELLFGSSAGALPTVAPLGRCSAGVTVVLQPSIVLIPSWSLQVESKTVNQPIDATFLWRERVFEKAEETLG